MGPVIGWVGITIVIVLGAYTIVRLVRSWRASRGGTFGPRS